MFQNLLLFENLYSRYVHYRFLVLVVNFEMQPLLLLLHKNVLGVLSFEIFVFHFFMLIIQQF